MPCEGYMHRTGMEAEVEATVPCARRGRRQPGTCLTLLHPNRLRDQGGGFCGQKVDAFLRRTMRITAIAQNTAPHGDRRLAVRM